jgi:hypothetical protein
MSTFFIRNLFELIKKCFPSQWLVAMYQNETSTKMLVIFHIFRKKHFKTNLENFMSESLNATSTPLTCDFNVVATHSKQNVIKGYSLQKDTSKNTKIHLFYLQILEFRITWNNGYRTWTKALWRAFLMLLREFSRRQINRQFLVIFTCESQLASRDMSEVS